MEAEWSSPTDDEILAQVPAARERSARAVEAEPRAESARYDERSGWTILGLANGCIFAFPPDVDEVRDLSPEERARVRVLPGGRGLAWEGTDAALSVAALIRGDYFAPSSGESRGEAVEQILRRISDDPPHRERRRA